MNYCNKLTCYQKKRTRNSFNGRFSFLKLEKLHVFFHKKLGSGHGTKSFLIQHKILSILVLKVSSLVSYLLNA